jgi:hypothetical protein
MLWLALAVTGAAAVVFLLIPESPPSPPPQAAASVPPTVVAGSVPAPPAAAPVPPDPAPPAAAAPPPAADRPRAKGTRTVRGHSSKRAPVAAGTDEPLPPSPATVVEVERQAAPAAPVPVAAPSPAPPPPPPPRPTTVDVEHASVSVASVSITSGIPGANVRAAVARLPLARCYREALRDRGSPAPGTATLQLSIDASGYVTSAVLRDAQFLPALRGCIEQAARSLRVRDVDTGEATATVTLSFVSTP